MKHITILFLAIMSAVAAYAQTDSTSYESSEYESEYEEETSEEDAYQTVDPATLNSTKNYSAEKLTVRKFDNKKWKDVVGTTDYNEETDRKKSKSDSEAEEAESRRRREQQYKDDEEQSGGISVGPWAATWIKIVFYAIVVAIIVLILYLIIKNTSLRSSKKVTKTELTDVTAHIENIADLDIDMLLQQAAGNYRLAVRLYFLGLLKKLNEGGFIIWKKDKTNRDYLTELYAKAFYYDNVRKLTLAYEQVWYGDYSISADVYHKLRDDFKWIDQQLNATIAGETK